MKKKGRYPAEVRERAARLLLDQQASHTSQWATIEALAAKIGCTPNTLREWVRCTERDNALRAALTSANRDRLQELERENRELKRAKEVLRKASAYFARAELDRRPT